MDKEYLPLTNEQIQVILTGKFGDGCLATSSQAKLHPEYAFNYYYTTSGINPEYIEYKQKLLGSLISKNVYSKINCGYKSGNIFSICTKCHHKITEIAKESLEDSLLRMDELGFALWIYDDGSLHQKKSFYNINTQAFSYKENTDIIVPFLKNKFGITATPTIERKRDGREYWYLRVKKYDGAFTISDILLKYPIDCFKHKIINDELLRQWGALQANLKNTNIDIHSIHPKTLCSMMNRL